MKKKTFAVCRGRFLVRGEPVPVSRFVLRVALSSAGIDPDSGPCRPIPGWLARRITSMERSYTLARLSDGVFAGAASDRRAS